MKILQITPSLVNAGAERFIVDLSNQLAFENHDVTLISLVGNIESSLLYKEIDNSIKIITFNKPKGFSLSCYNQLNKYISENPYDIIHTHTRSLSYISLFNIFKSRAKFVHTIHNDAKKETKQKVIRLYRKILFKFSFIYPVSISKNSHKSTLIEYGLDSVLIPNGSRKIEKSVLYDKVLNHIAQFKPTENTKVFVNIARIVTQKNQKLLTDVFSKLKDNSVDSILLIIGSVIEKHILNELKSNLPSNVFLLGEIDNATDYLFGSDVFSLSSTWEGMPISLIEAFDAGCVPICTPAGGVVNMINDGQNGFLSDDFSAQSLYSKILEYCDLNKSDILKMKLNCTSTYSKYYSMEKCCNNYINFYKKIL